MTFDDSLFSYREQPKVYKTRAQKRASKKPPSEGVSGREGLIRAQNEDPDIQQWAQQEKPTFKTEIAGVICRQWRPKGNPAGHCDQIVLPRAYREQALRLAHDVPMAGHLGRERTLARLRRRFWWLGLTRDTVEHCRTCSECQKTRTVKAPMIPMPVIGEPFDRIAKDVIGPLPKSASGSQSSW